MQFSSRAPFAKMSDYTNPKLWGMLLDIFKFTTYLMKRPEVRDQTTAEWVKEGHFAPEFYRHYFIPFVSILWTVPYEDVMKLPATQFLRCLCVHAQVNSFGPVMRTTDLQLSVECSRCMCRRFRSCWELSVSVSRVPDINGGIWALHTSRPF